MSGRQTARNAAKTARPRERRGGAPGADSARPGAVAASRPAWLGAAGVFGMALLVRLIYLVESSDYPAFGIPIIDAREYDHFARQWVAGGGMHTQFFWQPFLYPFFLSCVYHCTGSSLIAAKVLQVILGATTCSLTCVLGRRLFGPAVGLIAGLVMAVYGPLIFYEAELLASGWATFWTVALLLLFLSAQARPNIWTCLLLGIAGGLAVLTRPTFLPFLLVTATWLVWTLLRTAATRGRAIKAGVVIAIGFLLPTLPVALQNARLTGHFGFLPFSGGVNLYLGNHPDPDMVATAVGQEWKCIQRQAEREGHTAPYDRQAHFYRQARATILADPLGSLGRLGWKTLQFIGSRELPRSVNVYVVRQWSALQTVLTWKITGFGFPFGVLLPLATIGLAWRWRQIPVPAALFLVLYPLMIVLVFVTARYRLPVVPVLAILAAAGGVAMGRALRKRHWRRLTVALAGCGAIALLGSLPGPFALEVRDTETGLDLGIAHYYRQVGDTLKAGEYYWRELSVNPDSLPAHTELGRIMIEHGRPADALAHFEAAVRAKPHLAATHDNYGLALRTVGRLDEAAAKFREAIRIEPTWAKPWSDLGAVLLLGGHSADAVAAFGQAVRLSPDNHKSHFSLGIALDESGDLSAALGAFQVAVRLNPADVLARFALASALERAGQLDSAMREYQAVLRMEPRYEAARRGLERLLRGTRPAGSQPTRQTAPRRQ